MTATEAKKETDKLNQVKNNNDYERVQNYIKRTIKLGKYSIFISLLDNTKKRLEKEGYTVKKETNARNLGHYTILWN